MTQDQPGRRWLHKVVLATALLAGGCGNAAITPPAASPTAAPSVVAGPTSFADWTARQGFGGSSGLNDVDKNSEWIMNNPGQMTIGFVDQDTDEIQRLISWLDTHPATACWTAYHASVRDKLTTLATEYATLRVSLVAGKGAPDAISNAMAATSAGAVALAAPANCP
ncbi:MAG TPA: hypothetical protein VGM28_06840 [Candidatus Limnocylindrales bacterium]|jgi:hypothetical protein